MILIVIADSGLRPAEVFALRDDDIHPGTLRIDEAVKDAERGPKRIGDTKTTEANAYVVLTSQLEQELRAWAGTRPKVPRFPTDRGTPWWIGNYLKRVLKPLATSRTTHHGHDTSSTSADIRHSLSKSTPPSRTHSVNYGMQIQKQPCGTIRRLCPIAYVPQWKHSSVSSTRS